MPEGPDKAEIGKTTPVGDTVPKVDDAVAVGEDLKFQRRWWRFESVTWWVFSAILLADVLGLFGRGWIAKAERSTPDGTMQVRYERVARASTPSLMTIRFGPSAVRDRAVRLFVSESIVQGLGAQRVIPQPEHSEIGNGGVTYVFPVQGPGVTVQIALEPSFPGVHRFRMGVPGLAEVQGDVAVMP